MKTYKVTDIKAHIKEYNQILKDRLDSDFVEIIEPDWAMFDDWDNAHSVGSTVNYETEYKLPSGGNLFLDPDDFETVVLN